MKRLYCLVVARNLSLKGLPVPNADRKKTVIFMLLGDRTCNLLDFNIIRRSGNDDKF
jgi:hypothetical protein